MKNISKIENKLNGLNICTFKVIEGEEHVLIKHDKEKAKDDIQFIEFIMNICRLYVKEKDIKNIIIMYEERNVLNAK